MSIKRFSREGFQPLPGEGSMHMTNPNDATINIPLTTVHTQGQTGSRSSPPSDSLDSHLNEKTNHFRHGPAGRRRKMEKGTASKDDDDGTLTTMGKIYKAVLNFSVITRYFVYVLPLALMIAVPIVVGATIAENAKIGGVRMVWFFTWVEVVWLGLWSSKLVARFLPYLFQFLSGIVSAGTRKYSLVLTALEIPLSLVGWTLTALTTFVPLMCLNPDKRRARDTGLKEWESVVKNILFAAFFATLVLLAEKLIIQLLSISYHRKQFDQRIKQSKRNIYLLSLLYDASRRLFPAYCPEFADEDYLISDALALGSSRGPTRPGSRHLRSGSATPMRLIQAVGRVGDKLTSAFGDVAHEITGKQVFNPTSAHSIVVEALEKTTSSEALARRLWMSFVMEGKDTLYEEDVIDVLGPDLVDEAKECFQCIDRDANGDISLDEMIFTVCQFGKDRYSIASSMHDVDQAINVLDNLLCTVVFIITIFIFVAFLNKSFTTTLATAGTALLSMSFVFAVTAQEVLGSCIFLFVKHPYDIGDRVDIGDSQLVVERISLLYTIFRKVKDHKTTQVPNIVLNGNWIDNISRSKAMREQVLLHIHVDTTLEDIQLLKNALSAFVLDKENSRDFQPEIDVELTGIADLDKLELQVEIRHKSNWANEAVRAARRSKFMCALVLALRKVPIYGPGAGGAPAGDPANPTYSVAISNQMAEDNKKVFADKKDAKRLVPLSATLPEQMSKLSPKASKSSAFHPNITPSNAASTAFSAHDNSLAEALHTRTTALATVRDEADEDFTEHDHKRNQDIEEVRDILRQGSMSGRRRAPSNPPYAPFPAQKPLPSQPQPPTITPPPPASKQAPRVQYYDDTTEYNRPSTPGGTTSQPDDPSSSAHGNSNPYIPPLRTGDQYQQQQYQPQYQPRSQSQSPSQSQSRARSTSTTRRPVPGNAFSRFPVAPNSTQNPSSSQR